VGEDKSGPFSSRSIASWRVEFQGARVTSDGGLILVREFKTGLELRICKTPGVCASLIQDFKMEIPE
jgi:hypothetical protein